MKHVQATSRFDRWSANYLVVSGKVLRMLGGLALITMVGSHGLEVLWRLLFSRGLNWVHEFSLIVAMVLYFLMYSEVAKQGDYVRLDYLERRIAERAARHLTTVIRILVLAFHASVAWFAFGTARFAAGFTTTILEWPETVFYLPLAVGCADIVLTEAIFLVRHLRGDAPQERIVRVLT